MNDLFEHAPEGATELRLKLYGKDEWRVRPFRIDGKFFSDVCGEWVEADEGWQTIATRSQPERKTVEDAVEWNRSVEYGDDWYYTSMDVITFSEGKFAYSSHLHTKKDIICTREEFEACVAAKSEPEWTHLHMGEKCKIIYSQPDFEGFILTDTEEYGYQLYKLEDLDPIKPTISKAEAWDKLMQNKMNSSEVNTLKQKYTIT